MLHSLYKFAVTAPILLCIFACFWIYPNTIRFDLRFHPLPMTKSLCSEHRILLYCYCLFNPQCVSHTGDLLLKIQEFESSLLKCVTTSTQKWLNTDKHDKKTVGELFNVYNYLQKENPLEFGSLMELTHNIDNGE